MSATEQGVLNAQWNAAELQCRAAEQLIRPCVIFKPMIHLDTPGPGGRQRYAAIYGHIRGTGYSAEEAMENFDKAWRRPTSIPPKSRE